MAGVACGNFGNALGASLGLAALLAASALAFTVVKLAGAAYLVWLGWRALRAPAVAADVPEALRSAPVAGLFRQGFLVALLNPKTAIFFAAFLPQFMHGEAPALPQAIMLGAGFVVIAACSDLGYALLASTLAPRLRGAARRAALGALGERLVADRARRRERVDGAAWHELSTPRSRHPPAFRGAAAPAAYATLGAHPIAAPPAPARRGDPPC